jgi:hypothetical protein
VTGRKAAFKVAIIAAIRIGGVHAELDIVLLVRIFIARRRSRSQDYSAAGARNP